MRLENYLTTIKSRKQRVSFSKFRLSDHCLMIEKARHQRVVPERQHRICPFCPTEVEDELHFLTKCPKYNTRDDLFSDIENKVPNFRAMNDKQKFIYMMTMEDEELMYKIVHTVHDWLEIRANSDPPTI